MELSWSTAFDPSYLNEEAARREGFKRIERMMTLAGVPLYHAYVYESCEQIVDNRGGDGVPFLRVGKQLGNG